MVDDLKARLRRLLPVSWDNETDGHGEPTHAVLTFGEHHTQAITLCPDDWMVLNEIPDRIEKLEAGLTDIANAVRMGDEYNVLAWANLARACQDTARATLSDSR